MYPLETIELATNPWAPTLMPSVAWSPYGEIRAQYYDIHRLGLSGEYNSTRNGAVGDDMPDEVARRLRQHYFAAISFTDSNIGTVMRALSSSPAANSTVTALWGE
jgi:iduronate 2-sulfatase